MIEVTKSKLRESQAAMAKDVIDSQQAIAVFTSSGSKRAAIESTNSTVGEHSRDKDQQEEGDLERPRKRARVSE